MGASAVVGPLAVPSRRTPLVGVSGIARRRCWVLGVADLAGTAATLALVTGLRVAQWQEDEVTLGCRGTAVEHLVLRHAPAAVDPELCVCRLTFSVGSAIELPQVAGGAVAQGAPALRALRSEHRRVVHVRGPEGLEIGFEHRDPGVRPDTDDQLQAIAPLRLLAAGGALAPRPADVRLGEVTLAGLRPQGAALERQFFGDVVHVQRDVLPSRVVLLGRS